MSVREVHAAELPAECDIYYRKSALLKYLGISLIFVVAGVLRLYLSWNIPGHGSNIAMGVAWLLLGMVLAGCFVYLFASYTPQIGFDRIGIRRKYAPNGYIPWSDIRHIALVDLSQSKLYRQWNLEIVLNDSTADKYKVTSLGQTFPIKSLRIPLGELTRKPEEIYALAQAYFEAGRVPSMR